MVYNDDGQETVRRYLLGQLTDDEQTTVEQRLLTEDDFLIEMEIGTDEVLEDYLAKELTQTEREWFEQNFLASPLGKQDKRFAKALHRYTLDHPLQAQKTPGVVERLSAFWDLHQSWLWPATVAAVLVLAVSIFWVTRSPSPQNFATITLNHSVTIRSKGPDWPTVKLDQKGLRAILNLPAGATASERYHVDLLNEKGEKRTFEVDGKDTQSVAVEIPGAQLTRGRNVITLSRVNSDGTVERLPGGYHFIVE